MTHYRVRSGDTLRAIAERCYGDGQLWSHLADANPLARAGVLYEGQLLHTPPVPPRSLADARAHALPLGHMPVRLRLDGSGPLLRYDGFGAFGLSGLVGELIFHRHGPVNLGELTSSRLLGYRLEQLAWAKTLFVEHFCAPDRTPSYVAEPATGSAITQDAYHVTGDGYTITGRIGVWRYFNVHQGLVASPLNVRMRLAVNPSALFEAATLVLGDLPPHTDAPPERLTPLGKVLGAACPQLISPAALWVLTRDEACFLQRPPRPSGPAAEIAGTSPRPAPTPLVSKRTGTTRKVGTKKRHVKKRPPRR